MRQSAPSARPASKPSPAWRKYVMIMTAICTALAESKSAPAQKFPVPPRELLGCAHARQHILLDDDPALVIRLPQFADYRGEIRVPLINLGREPFHVSRGMRIAQLVVAPVVRVTWDEVAELSTTSRGGQGFGHSGV